MVRRRLDLMRELSWVGDDDKRPEKWLKSLLVATEVAAAASL